MKSHDGVFQVKKDRIELYKKLIGDNGTERVKWDESQQGRVHEHVQNMITNTKDIFKNSYGNLQLYKLPYIHIYTYIHICIY